MIKYNFLIALLIAFSSNAQTWQHIDASEYHTSGDFFAGSNIQRNFNINPYDNSIWMTGKWAGSFYINTFDSNGNYIVYDRSSVPAFEQFTDFDQVDFTSTKTFVVSSYSGLFSFDGATWELESSMGDGCSISVDADTVWMARTNENYIKWVNETNSMGTNSFRRIQSKNGNTWVSTGDWDVIARYNESTGASYYYPDTCNLLSWNNYDFKFPHYTDTLYTSSELGFSLAHNGTFIDSITPNNSTNMPSSSVIEFEFDQNDNIWALFAPDFMLSTDPTHLAFYDQTTKTWSNIYTGANSPLDFTSYMTFELDTAGNVWVINNGDLFILKMNNWPTWLDVLETNETQNELSFTVYPNPASEEIHIQIASDTKVDKVKITNVQGEVIQSLPFSKTIKLKNKPTGTYYIQLYKNDKLIAVEKIIVD